MEKETIQQLINKMNQNEDVALVTIVNTNGSSPRGTGSMMLVNKDKELIEGTIGGGAIEEKAKEDAALCIKRGISKFVKYELNDKGKENAVGMICGGNVDVFIKVFKSNDELLIIGAGHVGHKLSKMAKLLGYKVTIVDDREEFASKERFPEADEIKVGDVKTVLKAHPINQKTNIVIVSHGHKDDQDAVEVVANSEARYIGMIGSIPKIKICFKNLLEKGIDKERLKSIYSPIGLDLGGETPEEISLAIMAEIQAVKYKKDVLSLKNKVGSEIDVF